MPKRIFSEAELTYLRDNWFEPICDIAAHLNAGESTIRRILGEMGYVRPRGKEANLQLRSKENRKLVSNRVPEAWHNLPLTRQQAIDLGSSQYWDGKPCEREGHLSARKTTSGGCWECDLMDSKNRKGRTQD